MSEKPERCAPRRLAEWLNPTGEKKVHSLIDKVYQQKNLQMAWEKVKPIVERAAWTVRASKRLRHVRKNV
jgi:hypothetical protein